MLKELQCDRRLVRRGGGSCRYALATIEAPVVETDDIRRAVNLALVLDRSGSMRGDKIARVREAAEYAVQQLAPEDRFAVVAYDHEVRVIMASTFATQDAKMDAIARIHELTDRGYTDLCGGWLHGCQQVADYLRDDAVARCLLLSDGLANSGTTDSPTIVEHARQLRTRGIVTSTFGVGADFDEVLLQRLAEAGGGNFCFIANADDIPRFIGQELEETLDIAVRDAYVDVFAPSDVTVDSLNGFSIEPRSDRTRIALGALVSGQVIDPVIRLRFPRGTVGEEIRIDFEIGAARGESDIDRGDVCFEFSRSRDCDEQPRNRTVDRRVAALYAGRTTREAAELNRARRFDDARSRVERCADRIGSYAGDDPELQATLDNLQRSAVHLGQDMDAALRKHMHHRSNSTMKERLMSGASKRRASGDGIAVIVDQQRESAAVRAVRAVEGAADRLMGTLRVHVDLPVGIACVDQLDRVLSPVEELELIGDYNRRYSRARARILFVNARLHDNWFSHYHASMHSAISAIADWDDLAGLDLAAYMAYEILLNGLHLASPRFDLLEIAHDETRGCLFDFCGDKRDIEIKLQNMDVCVGCDHRLDSWGIPVPVVANLCARIRELARPADRQQAS